MEKIYNMVDIETIEKLAAIVNSNDLGEITIVDGGKTITVKGKKCPPPPPTAGAAPAPMSCVPQSIPPMVSYADQVETAKQSDEVSGTPVKAPIVGTYYSKPRPDASPFVTVGSTVKKGDVLYILETMKVMNEITAETDGIVAKILVSDGDSLEYGQTVMIIG